LYDTRHVVYQPSRLTPDELKFGYDWAYKAFYHWNAIVKASLGHHTVKHQLKHFFYAAGWKKFERAWDLVIRIKQLSQMRPLLEAVLSPARGGKDVQAEKPAGKVITTGVEPRGTSKTKSLPLAVLTTEPEISQASARM
jgi:hypothetical protein